MKILKKIIIEDLSKNIEYDNIFSRKYRIVLPINYIPYLFEVGFTVKSISKIHTSAEDGELNVFRPSAISKMYKWEEVTALAEKRYYEMLEDDVNLAAESVLPCCTAVEAIVIGTEQMIKRLFGNDTERIN